MGALVLNGAFVLLSTLVLIGTFVLLIPHFAKPQNVTSNVKLTIPIDKKQKMKKETELRESPLQLEYVERLKKLMLDWTSQNGIKLHTIECVIPFTLTDKSLIVWMFYETEQTKNDYENNGTNELVKIKYLELLKELNYPSNYLEEVTFQTDSDENVKKNYEGSYFYRLR